jgi:uncharacterized protein
MTVAFTLRHEEWWARIEALTQPHSAGDIRTAFHPGGLAFMRPSPPCSVLRYLAALFVLGWSAATAVGAAAGAPAEFYRAKTRVTGQTVEGRGPAIARCFADVLVKVSGDARLLNDARVAEAAKQAGALVMDFRYRDLMAGLPTNDEQGTRDRPYELTVSFDPAGVDAALSTLGRKPWTAERPRLVVLLSVRQGAASYMLAADGSRGSVMQEALAESAERVGLRALVPTEGALAALAGSKSATWPPADRRILDAATKTSGGDVALAGRLVWSEAALGWVAEWQLTSGGTTHAWQLRGVSFDDAFRSAMRGAAQILSGHGPP